MCRGVNRKFGVVLSPGTADYVEMYDSDSFFTLTLAARIGLVAVSTGFALFSLYVTRVLTINRNAVARLAIWVLLFVGFVWVSPQGYYTYYRLIFDSLPTQWVIGQPPGANELLNLLFFRARPTLSGHSVGILGWGMLVTGFWPQRRNCRDAAN